MPPASPIRLIAIDIDGTLLDGRGALPPRNRRAVHRAIEQGIRVVLVTGRAFPSRPADRRGRSHRSMRRTRLPSSSATAR